MKKNSKKFFVVAVVAMTSLPSIVTAQVPAATVPAKNQTACEKVTQKIDDRVKTYDEKAKVHYARFVKLIETLTNISARLKSRGQDTTALDGHISNLSAKREKLNQDKAAFLQKMQEAKTAGCTGAPNEIKTKIGEAKTLQQTITTDVKDFQGIAKTIRSTISALRSQISAAVASTTPANR